MSGSSRSPRPPSSAARRTVSAVQTFLPYADFARSASALDPRRLGKQRIETLQILRALHLQDYGWSHHPAVLMWRGHTPALVAYGLAVVEEWTARGGRDSTAANIVEFVHPDEPRGQADLAAGGLLPGWLGSEPLHRSHRSALLRKDPGHYRDHFPDVDDALDYVWPAPPAPPRPPGPRSAWVVRSPVAPRQVLVPSLPGEWPWTPLEDRSGRTTKRLRQVSRLIDQMRDGDSVIVPDRDRLHVARVAGEYAHDDGAHVRPVRWTGELHRTDLRFPAALQDPQDVFELFDEPVVADEAEG